MSTEDIQDKIHYSDKYDDKDYEYRHVILPQELAKLVPRNHLMTETEWRNLGVQQSVGWVHYCMHAPEPHVLLFRLDFRPIFCDLNNFQPTEPTYVVDFVVPFNAGEQRNCFHLPFPELSLACTE